MTDLNELTAEFTQRLTDAEKRISAVMKVSVAQVSITFVLTRVICVLYLLGHKIETFSLFKMTPDI